MHTNPNLKMNLQKSHREILSTTAPPKDKCLRDDSMIKLMPNELIGSYEIRYALYKNGKLTTKDCYDVIAAQQYIASTFGDTEKWRLFPRNRKGAFIKLLLGLYEPSALIYEHTYIKEASEEHGEGLFSWWNFIDYISEYHRTSSETSKYSRERIDYFKTLYCRCHIQIEYCPTCAKQQVENFGLMWFTKSTCDFESHSKTSIIGCPNCYLNKLINRADFGRNSKRQRPRTKKNRNDPELLHNRILTTMSGICPICNCEVWDHTVQLEEEIRNEKANLLSRFIKNSSSHYIKDPVD